VTPASTSVPHWFGFPENLKNRSSMMRLLVRPKSVSGSDRLFRSFPDQFNNPERGCPTAATFARKTSAQSSTALIKSRCPCGWEKPAPW